MGGGGWGVGVIFPESERDEKQRPFFSSLLGKI